jgi:predicted nucleic acid-binding protein
VQKPSSLDSSLNVDVGELEAICLAREIHAAAVLIDDRAGRNAAVQCGVPVIGTLGLLKLAAQRGTNGVRSAQRTCTKRLYFLGFGASF